MRTRTHRSFIAALLAAFVAAVSVAQERGELFDNVVRVLADGYYDQSWREETLPGLAARFRPVAEATASLEEERAVVHAFLSGIPASHLALVSERAYGGLMKDLSGEAMPTFGFGLVRLGEGYVVANLYEGGPAARAGLRPGDVVVAIDGEAIETSSRLDWRTDDAALPDPPAHAVLCNEDGEVIRVEFERRPGERSVVEVTARPYSSLQAARASVDVIERDGVSIGYVHFWYVHHSEMDDMLYDLYRGRFADADVMVLDLRGRGGSAEMVGRVVRSLRGDDRCWNKPVVALIDAKTRSAKEAIAFELRGRELATLVGETTAGALLPMGGRRVGQGAVLVYPVMHLGTWTDRIEGIGVAPHVEAAPSGAYSEGRDSITERGMDVAVGLVSG